MPSCSPCLCSFIFTGPARICGVTMSHNISRIFLTFSFIFARFGRFGGFVSAVSLVSLVSVVSVVSFRSFRSFRWFRFGRFVSLFRVLVHAVWGSSPNFTIQSGRNNTFCGQLPWYLQVTWHLWLKCLCAVELYSCTKIHKYSVREIRRRRETPSRTKGELKNLQV